MISTKIKKLRKKIKEENIDAVFVTSEVSGFYFLNNIYSRALILITVKKQFCFMDGRYYHRAQKEIGDVFDVIKVGRTFQKEFAKVIKDQKIKVLGIEHDYYTLRKYKSLHKMLRGSEIKLVDISQIINEMRIIKDQVELSAMQKAAKIADKAFLHILEFIKKNRKNLKETDIAWELEKFMRENGAERLSFESVVASGANSAFPHHQTSVKKIKKQDTVLLDFGCVVSGYCSDMSRTVFINKPTLKQKEVYALVFLAQQKALAVVKAGVKASIVDKAARDVIQGSKYKDKFIHGCGHGVGLEIHEAPNVGSKNNQILQEGMVITVEPGVYLNKEFGVRIEDLILVTKNGYKYLSKSSKKIINL